MKTQIIELEKKYWDGMENHDYETVKKLTLFPCLIAGKNGVQSVNEAGFKEMFESGKANKFTVVNISDVQTQIISENTAIAAYVIEFSIEGDKQKSPMKCACTSTWIKENNIWTCVMHTECELSSD